MIKKISSVRMQLVASVFVAIAPFLVLTYIVNQPWFWQYSPDWLRDYFVNVPWASLTVGLLALMAAWYGGERFILRQVRVLSNAAKRLGTGDMNSRTGLRESSGELGQLAEVFDAMAESLQQQVRERERAMAEVQKLAAFAQLNPNPALEFSQDGKILYFNEAVAKLAQTVQKIHPQDVLPPEVREIVGDCLATGRSKLRLETRLEGRTFSWSFHPVPPSGVVHCYIEDTTQRLSLEAQLRQAQKMESIGQLAAGVAHDFNNMLTIIQGHSSALLIRPALPDDIAGPLQAVHFAAERAASLTRQLLMFSRKNVMQTRPLDLREIVGNLGKMLQRLIGENIRLEFNPPAELPIVLADAGMIEQIVVNLSVNARDAMPAGGTLTISVGPLQLDEKYVETHPEAHVGGFVQLRVTDTGCGMDATTLMHIFEPFFTTKEIGKGTGLGLATVYGIVKQHDGWLEVDSEPGRGTTFNLFFPAEKEMAAPVKMEIMPPMPVAGGTETILIVEDEPVLREMARGILEHCGYRIVEASSGKTALDIWQRQTVDLLLTDMMMPEGVSGTDLAERLLLRQPDLKILFTSGYATNEISAEVLKKTNAGFLQKPYSQSDLAQAVRLCLNRNKPAAAN
jgi:signal transduction histidine kinase/ActR/RegA family two-component response regulator/HAMP domain-containing protein